MNKKRILILIIFVCILFITILSFFLIKNKSDKMEKFEINDSEKSENNNSENVNDGTESSSDGNSNVNKENNNKNTDLDSDNSDNNVSSEEDVVSYFEKNYNEIDGTNWDNIKDKAKGYFITIVDFIFYNGKIKGHTFNDLSSTAKLKIISIALKIDNKIEEYIPGYKETISSNGSKIYNNVKEKLVTLYLDISTEICKNHENGCNTAKEIFKDIKDNCRIGWDFVKKLVSSGTSKLKEWYEVYSGK